MAPYPQRAPRSEPTKKEVKGVTSGPPTRKDTEALLAEQEELRKQYEKDYWAEVARLEKEQKKGEKVHV